MTMTMAVYRINPETGARTEVRKRHIVKPVEAPETTFALPPCSCPRCIGGAVRLRARLAEVNERSRGQL